MQQILKENISIPEWSFKEVDNDQYRKLEKSIRKNGQLKSILVRSLGDGKYEVIDGKIVFNILKNLDTDYVWAFVKNVDETEAKLLYLQLDYDTPKDFISIAPFIKEICSKKSLIEVSRYINISVKELTDLITLNDFDFERYKKESEMKQDSFF